MRLVVFILMAAFGGVTLCAQPNSLDAHLNAARKARDQKSYADAEKEGAAAVQEAEKLGPLSPRLNGALADLASTFYSERKYAEAEPLYFRATELATPAGVNGRTLAIQLDFLGMTRFNLGKNEAALPVLEKALTLREQALGADHLNVGTLLMDLAAVQAALLKRDAAEASLRRALRIEEQLIGPDRSQNANTLMQLGAVLDGEAKYQDAESCYRDALKIREALFGQDNAAVADSLNSLAELVRHRGRNTEAEPLYRRALAISEKVLGPTSMRVARGSNNLALTLEQLDKPDEAEALFLRAIDIADKNEGAAGLSLSRYLGNLSALYRRLQRLPEAEKMAARALTIREKGLGLASPDLVYELQDLAAVYSDQHRYGDAEGLYRRSLAILQQQYGPNHPDVADEAVRLGNTLIAQKKFSEAEPHFHKALEVMEIRYGASALQTAAYVENLARFYNRASRFNDADPLYRRALAIREQSLPAGPERFATLQNNYAVFLRDGGRYREAVAILEKVTAAAASSGQPPSSVVMENLGDLYRRLGYYAKAEPLLMKAIDDARPGEGSDVIRLRRLAQLDNDRKLFDQASPLLEQALALAKKANDADAQVSIWEDLANVRRESRQTAEAAKLYNQALVARESEAPDSPLLAQLLDDMGLLAIRQNRFAEAEPLLLRAKRIYDRSLNPDNAFTALCLSHLAALYSSQKRFPEAEPLFKSSIAVQENAMGANAPALAPTLREYAQFCRLQNRAAEAAALEARAQKVTLASAKTAEIPDVPRGVAAAQAPTPVDLSLVYDTSGIYADGASFGQNLGLDDVGFALSANLLGSRLSWAGIPFLLGPQNAPDLVSAGGQTIALPPGRFSFLKILGLTAGSSTQTASQTFKVVYNDGTSDLMVQSLSDWFAPRNYPGETTVLTMPYRNTSAGAQDRRTFYLYGYSFGLDTSKTVTSVTLPGNHGVRILAMTLAPASPGVPASPSNGVINPVMISQVQPEYTDAALKLKIQGDVKVRLVVGKDGVPRDCQVTQSLEPGLDQRAIEAVEKWRFRPGTKDGQPVDVVANVVVNFRLLDKKQ